MKSYNGKEIRFSFLNRMWNKTIKISSISKLLLVFYLISLIPVFYISKYNFPSVDDFSNGATLKRLLENGASLSVIIFELFKDVCYEYVNMEGRFVSAFLLYINPASFGEEFYFVTPILTLGVLTVSTISFVWVFFKMFFNASPQEIVCIAAVWLFLAIQFLPSAVQGFFWYTGVGAHTFFYLATLIMYTMGILLLYDRKNNRLVIRLLMILLAFIVGGGSYTSAILTFFVFVMLVVLGYNKKWDSKVLYPYFLVFCVTFITNVLAPGNCVKTDGISIGVIEAIIKAVCFAVESIEKWLNLPLILAVVFLFPVFRGIIKDTRFIFKKPQLVLFFSFCLLVVQFLPHAYALGTIGPARLLNVIYFYFIFAILFNAFYFMGWLYQKTYVENAEPDTNPRYKGYTWGFLLIEAGLMLLCCIALRKEFPSTTLASVYSLMTGEAEQYAKENGDRLVLLHDENRKEVVLVPYSCKPMLLYWDDGGEDPDDWRNNAMEEFYEKKSIIVKAD